MGWAWNGKCYPDTGTALDAFKLDVPNVDAAGINAFTAAPSINATTGVITWSISNRPLSTTAATTRTGTTALQPCTYQADDKFSLLAQQDVAVAVGIGIVFVLGVIAGNKTT